MSDIFIQIFQRKVIIQRTFLEINTLDILNILFVCLFVLNHRIHKLKIKYIFQILKVSSTFQWEPENKTKHISITIAKNFLS